MDQNRDQWVATVTWLLNSGFRQNMGIYYLTDYQFPKLDPAPWFNYLCAFRI